MLMLESNILSLFSLNLETKKLKKINFCIKNELGN